MRAISTLSAILLTALLAWASPTLGDQVFFKNGSALQARVLERSGEKFIELEVGGGIVALPWAEVERVIPDPEDRAPELVPPEVSASSALLIDGGSGRVILEKNPRARRPIASLTKLMTAVIVAERGRLEDWVRVSRRAAATPGVSLGLRPGQRVLLRDLLSAMLVRSANDAAVAAAEHLCGREEDFVREMNGKALSLGLLDTHFCNCHGLDHPRHYSTASDMARLSQYAMSLPFLADCVKNREVAIWLQGLHRPKTCRNSNRLLGSCLGADGIKTGYTEEAGRCLVGSASRGGHRLIAVLLNDKERWQDACELFEYGFAALWKEKIQRLSLPGPERIDQGGSGG